MENEKIIKLFTNETVGTVNNLVKSYWEDINEDKNLLDGRDYILFNINILGTNCPSGGTIVIQYYSKQNIPGAFELINIPAITAGSPPANEISFNSLATELASYFTIQVTFPKSTAEYRVYMEMIVKKKIVADDRALFSTLNVPVKLGYDRSLGKTLYKMRITGTTPNSINTTNIPIPITQQIKIVEDNMAIDYGQYQIMSVHAIPAISITHWLTFNNGTQNITFIVGSSYRNLPFIYTFIFYY